MNLQSEIKQTRQQTRQQTASRKRPRDDNNNMVSFDDTAIILRASDFAARKHRKQTRKDPAATPMINHPIAVANIIAS